MTSVSGDTSALIAHIGTRLRVLGCGILGREGPMGMIALGLWMPWSPGEPLTCSLLPLLIKKVCRAYGGAGGEPLQPRPGFKLGRDRGRVRLQELLKRDGGGLVPLVLHLPVTPSQGLEMMEVTGGWGNIPHHCHYDQYEGQPELTHCSQLFLRNAHTT